MLKRQPTTEEAVIPADVRGALTLCQPLTKRPRGFFHLTWTAGLWLEAVINPILQSLGKVIGLEWLAVPLAHIFPTVVNYCVLLPEQ